jgi:hypothetical protein
MWCIGAIMPKSIHAEIQGARNVAAQANRPSGQIALGKEFAGRTAVVEEVEPGVWVVKLSQFVPDSERWLWQSDVQASLERAEAYAAANPAQASDLEALEQQARSPN